MNTFLNLILWSIFALLMILITYDRGYSDGYYTGYEKGTVAEKAKCSPIRLEVGDTYILRSVPDGSGNYIIRSKEDFFNPTVKE